jgi:hypothetical protein
MTAFNGTDEDRIRKARLAQDMMETLTQQGKIIEGGFASFHITVISPDAPPIQICEMRKAFFAGALHLFTSILMLLDENAEPTSKDIQVLELIQKELENFQKSISLL